MLATLAAYLDPATKIDLQRARRRLDVENTPDLVVFQVYITSANRAYRLAADYRRRGAPWRLEACTSRPLPGSAAHADTIFIGPGEDRGHFLADFRAGRPGRVYRSRTRTWRGCRRFAAT